MSDVVALGLAVLLVAALFALLLHLLATAAAHLRRRSAEPVLRRCDACGRGWRERPGRELSVVGLRVRRWAGRRSVQDVGQAGVRWFRPQGWSRCPGCLSTRVRTTGEPPTAEPWSRREKGGVLAVTLGAALLVLALVGLVL